MNVFRLGRVQGVVNCFCFLQEKTFRQSEGGGKERVGKKRAGQGGARVFGVQGLPKTPMTTVHAGENGPINEPTKLTNDSDKGATKQPQGCGKSCAYVIAVTLIVSLSVRQEFCHVKSDVKQ